MDKLQLKITLTKALGCHEIIECLISDNPEEYGLPTGSSVKTRVIQLLADTVVERKKLHGSQTSKLSPQENTEQDDGSEDSFGAF